MKIIVLCLYRKYLCAIQFNHCKTTKQKKYMLQKLVLSFTRDIISWLSGLSVSIAVFIGLFLTVLLTNEFGFVAICLFILCFLIELVISIMTLSHGYFEAINDKASKIRSYLFIAGGFAFNTILIYAAMQTKQINEASAYLAFVVLNGANIFRVGAGFIASSMTYKDAEKQQIAIAYAEKEYKTAILHSDIKKLNAKTDIELMKAEKDYRDAIEANKTLQLSAPAKVAAKVRENFENLKDAKEILLGKKPLQKTENKENRLENVENLGKPLEKQKDMAFDTNLLQLISINGSGTITVKYVDDIIDERKFESEKSIKSNRDIRKNPASGSKYNPDYADFLDFILSNLPEKPANETGTASKVLRTESLSKEADIF